MKNDPSPEKHSFAVNAETYSGFDQLPEAVKVKLRNLSKKSSGSNFSVILSNGNPVPDLNSVPEDLKIQLSSFFSSLQGVDGNKIPNVFQGNFFDFIKGLSGLKKQGGGVKVLTHILQNLPQSLQSEQNTGDVSDALDSPYSMDLASSKSPEKAQINPVDTIAPLSSRASRSPQAAIPLDPLKASQAGERFRVFVVVLAILGLIGFFGWDWIMKVLNT